MSGGTGRIGYCQRTPREEDEMKEGKKRRRMALGCSSIGRSVFRSMVMVMELVLWPVNEGAWMGSRQGMLAGPLLLLFFFSLSASRFVVL